MEDQCITVEEEGGRYFWIIEHCDGYSREEIPEYLYLAIQKFKGEEGMAKPLPVFQKLRYDRANGKTFYNVEGDTLKPKKLYCRYDGEDQMFACSQDGEPSHPIGNTEYIIKF